MKRFISLILVIFISSTLAQDLAKLLPAETLLAFGMQDWVSHQDKLQPYIDEFNRLELGKAFMAMVNTEDSEGEGDSQSPITDAAQAQDDLLKQWQEKLGDVELIDIFGQEAWMGISGSSSSPIPAFSLVTRLNPDVVTKMQSFIDEESATQSAETMTEGDYSFYVVTDTSAETLNTLAYSLQGDVMLLSSSPDVMRGLLRQLGGSNDPNLSTSDSYARALGQYGTANIYTYIDFATAIGIVAPLARETGFDALIDRLVMAFETAGVLGGVSRFTDDGMESQGFQAVNPDGGDASLLSLLTTSATADRSALDSAPADALSVNVSHADLTSWWNYLNEIAASQPELGGDLDAILLGFGLDLRTTFFNWVGNQVTTITTGVAESVEPGMPASNLLGETVYIFDTSDEAAAQAGIDSLIQTISTQVAAFADPSGGMGDASQSNEDISGVNVTTLAITAGVSLSYAVSNGKAMLATSKDGLSKVLANQGSMSSLDDVQGLLTLIPEDASGFTLSDNKATLEGSAGQIRSSIQMTAGLGGAAGLNFDATDAFAGKLEEFMTFIASRMGYSVSYSQREAEGVRSYGKSFISW
jgi:hypothetical protein